MIMNARRWDEKTIRRFTPVRHGECLAEVEVMLIEADDAWSPYLSVDDAMKLDTVRRALQEGDLETASKFAQRVYRLVPVAA